MVNGDIPRDMENTVENAENYMVLRNGELIQLDDLLKPGYSMCNLCALKPIGSPTTVQVNEERDEETGELINREEIIVPNPHYIPARCPMYESGSHCVIEEGLVIETVQTFKREGLSTLDKFTMFSVLNSMLNLHRLSRVGQRINFSNIFMDKEHADIANKYISMTNAVNNQYIKSLKEMLATRKDQTALKMQTTNAAVAISKNIRDAISMESTDNQKREKDHRAKEYDN